MKSVNIPVDQETYNRIAELANEDNRSFTKMVQVLLRTHPMVIATPIQMP